MLQVRVVVSESSKFSSDRYKCLLVNVNRISSVGAQHKARPYIIDIKRRKGTEETDIKADTTHGENHR